MLTERCNFGYEESKYVARKSLTAPIIVSQDEEDASVFEQGEVKTWVDEMVEVIKGVEGRMNYDVMLQEVK